MTAISLLGTCANLSLDALYPIADVTQQGTDKYVEGICSSVNREAYISSMQNTS